MTEFNIWQSTNQTQIPTTSSEELSLEIQVGTLGEKSWSRVLPILHSYQIHDNIYTPLKTCQIDSGTTVCSCGNIGSPRKVDTNNWRKYRRWLFLGTVVCVQTIKINKMMRLRSRFMTIDPTTIIRYYVTQHRRRREARFTQCRTEEFVSSNV